MKKYKDVTWFCDECDAQLDRQSGFNDSCGTWRCKNCGHVNYINEDNIVDDDIAERIAYISEVTKCEYCGGHHRKEFINGSYYWVCEDCGNKIKIKY